MNTWPIRHLHKTIGYVDFKITQNLAFIHDIYVNTPYRRCGHATRSINAIEKHIWGSYRDVTCIRFVTHIEPYINEFLENMAVQGGYTKLGSTHIDNGYPVEVMVFEKKKGWRRGSFSESSLSRGRFSDSSSPLFQSSSFHVRKTPQLHFSTTTRTLFFFYPKPPKMSARGKGKRLHIGKGKRHRLVLRDNIHGITKPALRRLARRGGVKRLSGLIYEENLKEYQER